MYKNDIITHNGWNPKVEWGYLRTKSPWLVPNLSFKLATYINIFSIFPPFVGINIYITWMRLIVIKLKLHTCIRPCQGRKELSVFIKATNKEEKNCHLS